MKNFVKYCVLLLCFLFAANYGFGTSELERDQDVQISEKLLNRSYLESNVSPLNNDGHQLQLAQNTTPVQNQIKTDWERQLDEESPMDAEEADFLSSQTSQLLNPNGYESESSSDHSPEWSERIHEERIDSAPTYPDGLANPLEEAI